jgi:monofunctional biosynthetic peptidoglycan transglycosylase
VIQRPSLKRLVLIIVAVSVCLTAVYLIFTPDVSRLKKKNPKKTALMQYRQDEFQKRGKKYRITQIWVPLSSVSPYLIKAVLIGEDDKFWSHEGFDYEAIRKAIEKDIEAGKFKFGGSTISQQLAKNLYLSPSKSPLRKIREAVITWRMEKVLSKRRILEIYLNIAEWGEGIFGIEAAAKHYFGKSASELDPLESARLVSVLPNPRKYNPLSDSRYVVHRSDLIYSIMVRRGILVPEYDEVIEEGKNDSIEEPGQEESQGESSPLDKLFPKTDSSVSQ